MIFIYSLIFIFASLSQTALYAQKKPEPPKTEMKSSAVKITQVDDAAIKEVLKPNGKPLLVNFWATWCDPCREEFPDLVKIENDYRGKIDVVTVSLDDITEINTGVPKFLSEMKAETVNYLLVSKDESALIATIAKDWSGGLPFTILYNEKGDLIYFRQGKFKVPELREKIDSSIQNKYLQKTTSSIFKKGIVPEIQNDYERGRTAALKDISEGKFNLFTVGRMGSVNIMWSQILKERFNIELKSTGCLLYSEILSFNIGYNEISEAEIKKKFGENILTETKQEAEKLAVNNPANVILITLTKK